MKKCKYCGQIGLPSNDTAKISSKEWVEIKKGSILKSPSGILRKVVSPRTKGSIYITFQKLYDPLRTTTYVYHDLYKKYTIVKV